MYYKNNNELYGIGTGWLVTDRTLITAGNCVINKDGSHLCRVEVWAECAPKVAEEVGPMRLLSQWEGVTQPLSSDMRDLDEKKLPTRPECRMAVRVGVHACYYSPERAGKHDLAIIELESPFSNAIRPYRYMNTPPATEKSRVEHSRLS